MVESSHIRCMPRLGAHLLLAMSAWAMACEHPDRYAASPVNDGRWASAPDRAAALAAVELSSHAAFDALEDELEQRGGLSSLLPVYEALAEQRPADVLLRVRSVLLLLRMGGQGRVQKAIPLVDGLRTDHPNHPDVVFALGAIKRLVIFDPISKALFAGPQQNEIAQRLLEDWRRLLELAPGYAGPHGEDATAIRAQIAALETLLQESPAPSLPSSEEPPVQAMAGVLAYLDARERFSAERACAAGQDAMKKGGSAVLATLGDLVKESCRRATSK